MRNFEDGLPQSQLVGLTSKLLHYFSSFDSDSITNCMLILTTEAKGGPIRVIQHCGISIATESRESQILSHVDSLKSISENSVQ